jgi:3-hydroxy acid dehydrogenase / malonic semialdehyde reductase
VVAGAFGKFMALNNIMNMTLTNQTVLVTGATSGIGEACARLCADAGASLILWARRTERLQTLADELSRKGIHVLAQSVDVTDRQAVHDAVAAWTESERSIDVLVNNAGLSRGLEPIHEGLHDNWDEMIDTNIKGLLNVTRTILPSMVDRGRGTVINIASIAGRTAYRGGNIYAATKAAVRMLSDSMQIDLNGTGVRVCNIDPGLVETEFSLVRFRGDTERAAGVYKGYRPLTGDDIADVVLWVATRPPHVSIQDILITPTDQATPTIVHRTA